MNRLIEFFTRRGIFADLLTVTVLLVGIISFFQVKREVFPNVSFEVISITTIFPGASPEEVEKLVSNPIERALKEVDGIKKLSSISTESRSFVVAQLDPDQTTEDEAKTEIQDAIDRITDFPEDVEEPLVQIIESKQAPIIEVAIYGDVPEIVLKETQEYLEEEIENVPGVARVETRGGRNREVRVEADSAKLNRYRLSLVDLVSALSTQNVAMPGGTVEPLNPEVDIKEKIIRTTGEFRNAEDVANTVVRSNELGQIIQVKDVAKVTETLSKPQLIYKLDGKPALGLTVLIKANGDSITVTDALKARMEEIRPQLKDGINMSFINDMSYFIRRRLNIMTGNLIVGLVLVLVVLTLLLPFRVSLIVSLGIPLGFLGTMVVFDWFGFSINLISLMGLIIVVGMLVDDAIVVTENAVRYIEKGEDPKTAAVKGTQEVWPAVTASVATTIFVFLPMVFMSGIFGKFARQMPIGVIAALSISLLEAFFVLPYHVGRWIKLEHWTERHKGILSPITRFTDHLWEDKMVPAYSAVLKFVIRRRYLVAGTFMLLFIGSIIVAASPIMKKVLFPKTGIEIFFIRADAPIGTSIERTALLLKPIENEVMKLPPAELDDMVTMVGIQQQDPHDPSTKRGGEYAQIVVYLTPEETRDRLADDIIEEIRQKIGTPPGLERISFDRVNPGPPGGKPISIGVQGEEFEDILPAVAEVKELIQKIEGTSDIVDTHTVGKEEIEVRLDPVEVAASGLNVQTVGTHVRAAFEGIVATTIKKLDEEIDVKVSLRREERAQSAALDEIYIRNMGGALIPLSRIASYHSKTGVAAYRHQDNQREIRVNAEINTDIIDSPTANAILKKQVPELKKKYPNLQFDFGGEDEDTQESFASLGRAYIVAMLCILLILVFIFQNLIQPLLVVTTIPVGIMAVLFAFFARGLPFTFFGALGIIALSGVIVNNAIVFIDFVNGFRAKGADRWQSIIEAGNVRLRAIFLTTLTTVFGVLPTAHGIGGLDPFVVPIATAIGWGLLFGSLFTAISFPAAIAVLDDVVAFFRKRKGVHPDYAGLNCIDPYKKDADTGNDPKPPSERPQSGAPDRLAPTPLKS